MTATPKIRGFWAVFVGEFNPPIFHPSWLLHHELIREPEAESAEIKIVHAEVSQFHVANMDLSITRSKVAVTSTGFSKKEAMQDLVVGIFELLDHTPIRQVGINLDTQYSMGSEQEWHDIGHKLAPKEPWKGIVNRPGMRSVLIEGENKIGEIESNGYIRVKVEPSTKYSHGIFVNVNCHYEVENTENSEEARMIVKSNWELALAECHRISDSIVGIKQ